MFRVLVADKDVQASIDCCEYLAKDKSLDVISANTGISVLNKYREIHPNILVINSDFEDKSFTEIINEISTTSQERNNSNIILSAQDGNVLFHADYAAKIYKFFKLPPDKEKIKNGIEQYYLDKFIFYEPNDDKLTALFYKLDMHNDLDGADYFRYAIQECYKDKKLLKSLNTIYIEVAKHFNVSYESVRPAMRNVLESVNSRRKLKGNKGFFRLFEDEDFITPKNFIRIITTHYLKQKNRNK